MTKILANIPYFVWPLFIILLFNGIKARKPHNIPLALLFALPSGFFIWSFFTFFKKYTGAIPLISWPFFLFLGFWIGFVQMQSVRLRFNRENRSVEMPGSWLPLILSMAIFFSKFSIGMIEGLAPNFSNSFLLLCLELTASATLGVFIGRATVCVKKYQAKALS